MIDLQLPSYKKLIIITTQIWKKQYTQNKYKNNNINT